MKERFNPPKLSWFITALAVLSACVLISVSSCGSSSTTSTPPPPPSPSPSPSATAAFTAPHDGSTVLFTQDVTGRITNSQNGMAFWLVVQPLLAPQYWPQHGPLSLDPSGRFQATAYIGQSSSQSKGEKVNLLIVEAPRDASQRFSEFSAKQQGSGMERLPDGTTTLAKITVVRG